MKVFLTIAKLTIAVCLGVIAVYLFLEKIDLSNLDLGRHIQNGQLLFSHPEIFYQNFYSYTQPDFPFVNHHWLSGLFFYWTKSLFGWNGLSLMALGLMVGAVVVSFYHSAIKSNFWFASFWMMPAILLFSDRTEIRPEMFSNLLLVLYVYLIARFNQTENKKIFFLLVGLQLLWANLHIYSIFGLALIGFAFLDRVAFQYLSQGKKISAKGIFNLPIFRLLVSSVIVSLATPNFVRGLIYPFNILRDYGYEIVENKSIFYIEKITINYDVTIFKVLFVAVITLFVWSWVIERKTRIFEGLVIVFFGALGFFALRNIAVFGIIVAPFASRQAFVIWQKYSKKSVFLAARQKYFKIGFAVFFLAIVFLVMAWTIGNGYFYAQGKTHQFGIGLAPRGDQLGNFIQKEKIGGKRIFNNYDLGSYLDYFLAPGDKVFVDNRPEAFSVAFFDEYRKMQTNNDFWDQQLEKYDFQFIIFSHTDGTPWAIDFMEKILKDPQWKMVYFDQYAFILARDSHENGELIRKYAAGLNGDFVDREISETYQQSDLAGRIDLVNFLLLLNKNDMAERYCRDLQGQQPRNFQITLLAARVLLADENREKIKEAELLIKKAISQGARLSSAYNQLGVVNAKLGDMMEAQRAWNKALETNPDDEWAKYYLQQSGF